MQYCKSVQQDDFDFIFLALYFFGKSGFDFLGKEQGQFSDGYDLKVIIFSVTNARKKIIHINRNSLHSDRKCRMRHTQTFSSGHKYIPIFSIRRHFKVHFLSLLYRFLVHIYMYGQIMCWPWRCPPKPILLVVWFE